MATILENKTYLEDSSRFPKLTSVEVTLPRYQHTSEEYNRIIEYLSQLYELTQSSIRSVDAIFNESSTNPLQNGVITQRLDNNDERFVRKQVSFFKSILASGTDKMSTSVVTSTSDEVFFFTNNSTFGYVPNSGGITPITPQYYSNWANRDEYTHLDTTPYVEKLYYCISDRKLYVWQDNALIPVGGADIQVDSTLSTTSTNPVENQAITNELNSLRSQIEDIEVPTTRSFYIDQETGELTLTQAGHNDETSFELDNYGYFNMILT